MAITYGMSVKEFWEENPDLFWAFRFSYLTKLKTNQEIFNNQAWLQGAYFYEAVSTALNNGFNKQKIKYSEKPYDLFNDDVDDKKRQNKAQEELINKIKGRIAQVQVIKGKEKESSTTKEEGKTDKGGEKIDEQSNSRVRDKNNCK